MQVFSKIDTSKTNSSILGKKMTTDNDGPVFAATRRTIVILETVHNRYVLKGQRL